MAMLRCRGGADADDGPATKRQRMFTEHLNFSACNQGIKAGRLHQGSLAVNRNYAYEGKVSLKGDIKVRHACCHIAHNVLTCHVRLTLARAYHD